MSIAVGVLVLIWGKPSTKVSRHFMLHQLDTSITKLIVMSEGVDVSIVKRIRHMVVSLVPKRRAIYVRPA